MKFDSGDYFAPPRLASAIAFSIALSVLVGLASSVKRVADALDRMAPKSAVVAK